MNIYIKWGLVVALNSVLGFILGYQSEKFIYLAGMISGVLTWFFIYLFFDMYLQKAGYKNASRKLFLCAVLRIPVQFVVFPDMYAGMFAKLTITYVGFIDVQNYFAEPYFSTVFTGLYLSVICSLLYFLISIFDYIKSKRKTIVIATH